MSYRIKRIVTALLLLLFLSSVIVNSARALVLAPGVSPGDTFAYDVTAFWRSNDEYASIPAGLIDYNQTETVEVRINDVSDSNVTIFVAFYYRNDTEEGGYGNLDVDTGLTYGLFSAIIAGNLNAQEVIHPLGADGIRINETVIKAYEGGSRETNRILIEQTNATAGVTARTDRFFDRETGILVESHETETLTNPETTTTVSWSIKSSNVWVIPEFPSVVILPLLMIATVLVIIGYKKKIACDSRPLI